MWVRSTQPPTKSHATPRSRRWTTIGVPAKPISARRDLPFIKRGFGIVLKISSEAHARYSTQTCRAREPAKRRLTFPIAFWELAGWKIVANDGAMAAKAFRSVPEVRHRRHARFTCLPDPAPGHRRALSRPSR